MVLLWLKVGVLHAEKFQKTEDGRFMGTMKAYAGLTDKTQLMRSVDLTFEWWTLLGEPVEIYHVKWEANDHIVYKDQTIHRNDLLKYPDLLKLYDNLRPYKISFRLEGSAEGNKVSVRRGSIPANASHYSHINTYKKSGKSYDEYKLYSEFGYIVDDIKLLPTKAGKLGNGIVPGSPHWNEFLRWGSSWDYNYSKVSKDDEALKKTNQSLFKNTSEIDMRASVVMIEWHEFEIKNLFEKFDRYNKGEEVPTPQEEVDSALASMEGMESYDGDDEWAEPVQDFKMEKVRDDKTGKYGYRNEYGQAMIPPKFEEANDFVEGKAVVRENGKSGIINKQGQYLLQLESGYISQVYQNIIVVRSQTDWKYALYNLQGQRITDFKFTEIGKFENGVADASIKKREETLDYDYCDERYLTYYDEGQIDVNGRWVKGPSEFLNVGYPMPKLTLTRTYYGETDAERRARERRAAEYKRKKEACIERRNAELKRIKNAVEAKGGRVSD